MCFWSQGLFMQHQCGEQVCNLGAATMGDRHAFFRSLIGWGPCYCLMMWEGRGRKDWANLCLGPLPIDDLKEACRFPIKSTLIICRIIWQLALPDLCKIHFLERSSHCSGQRMPLGSLPNKSAALRDSQRRDLVIPNMSNKVCVLAYSHYPAATMISSVPIHCGTNTWENVMILHETLHVMIQ